jgi:WD40 repeat protein
MSGDLLGTLRYMSPEQALAKRIIVDERTDIYSLGVTLYELLTLEPAFPGTDRQEVLRRIAFDDPKPPRRLNKRIPQELETIFLKAIEKNPADRYATAKALADDLQHFLDDKPIRARRPTLVQRVRKWTRRHNGVVRVAAAALVVLLLALAVSNVWITRLSNEKDDALREKGTALTEKSGALAKAKENFDEAEKQRKLAVEKQKLAEKEELTARRRYYAAQMNLAIQAWEAGQPARVLELLEGQRPKFDEEDLRGFEWYYLMRLCKAQLRFTLRGHRDQVSGLAFSPDGKILASGDYQGFAKLWDVATGSERATLIGGRSGWGPLAFSPDGKVLAFSGGQSSDATVTVWEVATGRKLTTLQGSGMVPCLAFSVDGNTLASGDVASTVQLWDVATWQRRSILRGHRGRVRSVAFSPDGKTLASGSDGYTCNDENEAVTILWDLSTEPPRPQYQLPGAFSVAFSPDGRTLARGWNHRVHLYDVETGKERASFRGHVNTIHSVVFSPDGKTLASTGSDRAVRLWEVASGQQRACLVHRVDVLAVAFSPDGRTLASGDANNLVQVWDAERPADQITLQQDTSGVGRVAFSSDGKRLISVGREVKLWDLPSLQATVSPIHPSLLPNSSHRWAVSPDGKRLASRDEVDVKLWDLLTGQIRAVIPGKPGEDFGTLAFSPDSKTLAIRHGSALTLWDEAAQKAWATVPVSLTGHVAFSPDGKRLAAGSWAGWLKVWDVSPGQQATTLLWEQNLGTPVGALCFSPDSKTLASGSYGGTVMLWDADSGQLLSSFKGHTDDIPCLGFFPDGKTLATGSLDTTIRLWDVATGQERATLRGHKVPVATLAIAPAGNLLASAGWDDGSLMLWRAATDNEATARKTELARDDPASPVAQNNLGDNLRARGRAKEAGAAYRQALARLEKLVTAFPNLSEYRRELARTHEGLQQWDQAALEFSRLIELQPDSFEPWFWQAEFYVRRGLWEKAADNYAKASELSSANMDVHFWLALTRLRGGDLAGYHRTCSTLIEHFGQKDLPDSSLGISFGAWDSEGSGVAGPDCCGGAAE